MLVAQTWIDLHTQRLPRSITYTGIVLGGIALTITAIVIDEPERIWMMVLGAAIALVAMWLIFWISKGGMGDGDVRLAPLLGMYLGWLNPAIVLPGLFFGFIAGAVVRRRHDVDRQGKPSDGGAVRAVPGARHLGGDLLGTAVRRPRLRPLTGAGRSRPGPVEHPSIARSPAS